MLICQDVPLINVESVGFKYTLDKQRNYILQWRLFCPHHVVRIRTAETAIAETSLFYNVKQMKKAPREMQTLRAGCSKVEPNFSPVADPLPGGAGRPKFNQLEMALFGEDRCTQFRVIVVTDPQTHINTQTATNPQTGPITIHCAAKLSAQCNDTQIVLNDCRINFEVAIYIQPHNWSIATNIYIIMK